MRQRRPKNLTEKIDEFADYIIADPKMKRGSWREGNRKLFLEIGTGKGRFITGMALKQPDDIFVGFEGQDTVIIRALEKINEKNLNNILMCQHYINDFGYIFAENELDGIYLNFSDPWPKKRHEKRRLTSSRYLKGYSETLRPDGFIKMKTDNNDLFDYSMEQFESFPGFDIFEYSRDLHNSAYNEGNIMTEYEKKFSGFDKRINYVCVIKR